MSVFDVRDIATLQSQNKAYPFNADVAPLQPTWDAVKEYYEWVYDDLGLVIPEEAVDVLRNSSFTDLTGCPVRCSYTSKSFPSENSTSLSSQGIEKSTQNVRQQKKVRSR